MARRKTTLLLGLGNDILGDDAIGLQIVRELRRHLPADGLIEAIASEEMGLALLDYMVGYQRLVLVDSVKSGFTPVGTLRAVPLDDVQILPLMSPHFFGVSEILRLGEQLELPMPKEVLILAVEVGDPFTIHEGLSTTLQAQLPDILSQVWKAVTTNSKSLSS